MIKKDEKKLSMGDPASRSFTKRGVPRSDRRSRVVQEAAWLLSSDLLARGPSRPWALSVECWGRSQAKVP